MSANILTHNCELEDRLRLYGDGVPCRLENISLTGGAQIERGMLLAGEGGVYSLAGAGDTAKSLCIAAEDFTADSINAVASAYFAGTFNRDKIIVGMAADSLSIDAFEPELRKQNIWLTGVSD